MRASIYAMGTRGGTYIFSLEFEDSRTTTGRTKLECLAENKSRASAEVEGRIGSCVLVHIPVV